MPLEEYRKQRDFSKTAEPGPGDTGETPVPPRAPSPGGTGVSPVSPPAPLIFVVQEHHATHLHWDFRLELEGVLKSWAVPKGPPEESGIKRLAQQVEDHPLKYATFEGGIPAGEYGAGTVQIWDHGTWEPQGDPHEQLAHGDLKIILHGKRLQGGYALVRFKKAGDNSWLLIKEKAP